MNKYTNFSYEDPTCEVMCDCGETLVPLVSDYRISRCLKCGKGYKTEFVVWQYEPEEEDED